MSQTEPRRSDSDIAQALNVEANNVEFGGEQARRRASDLMLDAADRLSESREVCFLAGILYAAEQAKLPWVKCPTCGGIGFLSPYPSNDGDPCSNPDCDRGLVQLTLADAVELACVVHNPDDEWPPGTVIAALRSVRA